MGSGTTHRATPMIITTATNPFHGLKQHRHHLIEIAVSSQSRDNPFDQYRCFCSF